MLMSFYYIELYKLFKRKDVLWSLLLGIFVPILFGVLMITGSGSINVNGHFSAIQYASGIFGFFKIVFLPYIIFIIFSSSSVANELEKGNISMLLVRSTSRLKVILAKFLSLSTIVITFIICVAMSGVSSFYFLVYSTKYSTKEFLGTNYLPDIYSFILSGFEFILIIAITMLLSLLLSTYKTLIVSIGFVVLMKAFESVDSVKRFIPTYMGNGSRLATLRQHELSTNIIQTTLVFCLYISIILVVICYYFSRMDVKN